MQIRDRRKPVRTTYEEWADELAGEERRRADRSMTIWWLAMFIGIAVLTIAGRL